MNLQGRVSLTYEGREYLMTISMAALCVFEEVTGKNGFTTLQLLSRGGIEAGLIGARDLRALVYAGLRVHDPEMTLDLAAEILDANAESFVRGAAAAMPQEGDVPAADDAGENPPSPASVEP